MKDEAAMGRFELNVSEGDDKVGRFELHIDFQWYPPFAITLTAVASPGQVLLSWISTLICDRYDIYRDAELIGVRTQPDYNDATAADGVQYTYFVRGTIGTGPTSVPRTADSNSRVVTGQAPPSVDNGVRFWWDAELGRTMVSTKVSDWADQVGGVTLAQSTDAKRPVYDSTAKALQFTESGATVMFTTSVPLDIPLPYTQVLAMRRGANNTTFPDATVRLAIRSGTAAGFHKYSFQTYPGSNYGTPPGGQEFTGLLIDSNYHVLARTCDVDRNVRLYLDGALVQSYDGATEYSGPTGATVQIGGDQDAGAGNFWVKHLIYYARALTPTEVSSLTLQLVSAPPQIPVITTQTLPSGTNGSAYSQQLEAGGDGTITWSVVGGSLPGGSSLSSTGLLDGTLSGGAGTSNFTVQASSEYGSATQALSIVVQAAPGASPPTFGGPNIATQSWFVDQAITSLDVSGLFSGETGYELVGSFPAGISINGSGVLSGTPTAVHSNPFCAIRATNVDGGVNSNYFSVTAIDTTPELANLLLNSTLAGARPDNHALGRGIPHLWDNYAGAWGGTINAVNRDATYSSNELDVTVTSAVRFRTAGRVSPGYVIGQPYTWILDVTNDASSTTTIAQVLGFENGTGFQLLARGDQNITPGTSRRAWIVFRFNSAAANGLTECNAIFSKGAGSLRVRFKNPMIVAGDYRGNPPAFIPTGPSIPDANYINWRDLASSGRTVTTTQFGFGALHEGLAYQAGINDPNPIYPRMLPGAMRLFLTWRTYETSAGVWDWEAITNYSGTLYKRMDTVRWMQSYGIPFTLVMSPEQCPAFYPRNYAPNAADGSPIDLTKWQDAVAALLEQMVPYGMIALEPFNEAAESYYGDLGRAFGGTGGNYPVTGSALHDHRIAAAHMAKIFRYARVAIDAYNTAHSTNVQMYAPSDQSNYNNAPIAINPGYTPSFGGGALDASDGAGGIGIDHLNGLNWHGYDGVDNGMQNLVKAHMMQHWAAQLGRPDIPVWMAEGCGASFSGAWRKTVSDAVRMRTFMGFFGSMAAYDGLGCSWYAWAEGNDGFYSNLAWPVNYLALEEAYRDLVTLLTAGGRKVYAVRSRVLDNVIELLVGTTRGGASWYALDETFVGVG